MVRSGFSYIIIFILSEVLTFPTLRNYEDVDVEEIKGFKIL